MDFYEIVTDDLLQIVGLLFGNFSVTDFMTMLHLIL